MLKTAAMEISANWIKYSTCGQFINKTEKLHHWIFIFITSFSVCKFKKQGYTDKQKREAGVNDTSVKEKAGFFSSSGGRSVNRLLHRWPSHTHTGRPTDLTGGHINTSKESSIQKHIPRSVWTTAVFFCTTLLFCFLCQRDQWMCSNPCEPKPWLQEQKLHPPVVQTFKSE